MNDIVTRVVKNIESITLDLASKFEGFSRVTLDDPRHKTPIRGLVLDFRGFQILLFARPRSNFFEDPRYFKLNFSHFFEVFRGILEI